MSGKNQLSKTGRSLIVTAAFIIILAGIKASGNLLIPLLLAIFIAMIADMPLTWMQAKGLPRWIGLIIVLVIGLFIEVLLVIFIGDTIDNFTAAFPAYEQRLVITIQNLQPSLDKLGISVNHKMLAPLIHNFNPNMIMGMLGNVVSGLGSIFSNGFVIFLLVSFILLEIPNLPAKMEKIRTSSDEAAAEGRLHLFNHTLRDYLVINTAISLLTGVLIAVWLTIIGVDFPILWGFLAFMLNFVPNIGSIIAAIPAILLAFLQGGINLGLMTTLCYVVVNVLVGNIISPKVMSSKLGLSTLVVFLSLIFWGWLLGPVGMLLSIPLTMFIKIAVEDHNELGWLATILGNGEELKADTSEEKG